jgi:hypothetical protein
VFFAWDAQVIGWAGTHLAWDGVVSKGGICKPKTQKGWETATKYVARKHGLVLEPEAPTSRPIRLGAERGGAGELLPEQIEVAREAG